MHPTAEDMHPAVWSSIACTSTRRDLHRGLFGFRYYVAPQAAYVRVSTRQGSPNHIDDLREFFLGVTTKRHGAAFKTPFLIIGVTGGAKDFSLPVRKPVPCCPCPEGSRVLFWRRVPLDVSEVAGKKRGGGEGMEGYPTVFGCPALPLLALSPCARGASIAGFPNYSAVTTTHFASLPVPDAFPSHSCAKRYTRACITPSRAPTPSSSLVATTRA